MSSYKYTDVILEIRGQIGIIKLNRPERLNTFGGNLIADCVAAVRELNEHPTTVFTVITGAGRFFSAGADLKSAGTPRLPHLPAAQRKLHYMSLFSPWLELVRSLIDHRKIYILALNGPAVGGGGAFFAGVSDLTFASKSAYMMVPFSSLGLVPEMGTAVTFAHKMGVAKSNEFLMFGRKWPADELLGVGMVNRVFASESDALVGDVVSYLEGVLQENEGRAMIEVKKAANVRLRTERIVAIWDAVDALAERFVEGEPFRRVEMKVKELQAKSKERSAKL